jgi:catechol 2,3-dioxygenase-like lactoylglutathione lyase family enzyme
MLRNPRYVLAVPDLARSAAYYRDVLGFTVHEIGDPGWRVFARDACVIMAGECPDATAPRDLGDHSWFAYVEVDPIDAFYAEVSRAAARSCSSPCRRAVGMREFGVRTADGHRIMFGSPCLVPNASRSRPASGLTGRVGRPGWAAR